MMTYEQSQEIWALIKHIKVAMLTTACGQHLRARPMYLVQSRFDGTLWFITSESTARADKLHDNKQVCLAWSDNYKDVYVSMSGSAGLTRDKALINKFWNETAAAWFENGKEDEDITLLEVHVEQAEVWDAGKNAMTVLFDLARNKLGSGSPRLGEHRKYVQDSPTRSG